MAENTPIVNKKKSRKGLWIVLIVLLVLVLCAGGIYAVTKIPLAARLFIKTATPTAVIEEPIQIEFTPTPVIQPAPNPTNTAAPVSTCGLTGSTVILVTAADLQTWDVPHTADFIRYIKIDFAKKTVTAVGIPRDLWVQTPDLAADNINAYRLGEVYFYSISHDTGTVRDKMIHATTLEAQVLYDNFGIIPDHYLTLDAGAFAPMIDTLGGIDIDNPTDIVIQGVDFPPMRLHLTGDQASIYSRWMATDTEWDRMARQKTIIQAVWNKALEPANLASLPKLVGQFSTSYVSDLNMETITNLICMVDKVSQENVHFVALPRELVTNGPNLTLLPDTEKVKQFLQEQLAK